MNKVTSIKSAVIFSCILWTSGCQKQSEVTREKAEYIMSIEQISGEKIRKGETRDHYFVLQNFMESLLMDLWKDEFHPEGRILEHELIFQNMLMSFESSSRSESKSPKGAKWLFQNVNIDEDIGNGRPGKYRQLIQKLSTQNLKKLPKEIQWEINRVQKEPLGNTSMPELGSLLKKYEHDPFVNTFMALLYQSVLVDVLEKKEQRYQEENLFVQFFKENPIEKQIDTLEKEAWKLLINKQWVDRILINTVSRPYPKSSARNIDEDSLRVYFTFLRQNPEFAKSTIALINYNWGRSQLRSFWNMEERHLESIIVGYLTMTELIKKYPNSLSGFEK